MVPNTKTASKNTKAKCFLLLRCMERFLEKTQKSAKCVNQGTRVWTVRRFATERGVTDGIPNDCPIVQITRVDAVSNTLLAESGVVCVGPSTVRTEEVSHNSCDQGNGTEVEELNIGGHDTGTDPSIGLQLALYVPAETTNPIVK
ncbi:hypothetical protein IFM89_039744 [Coptis chinensis]|uniref:Uncharacterized protein n=1 Tax=Coptis chinensis TaxID=261450 RepID=A0A835GW54_9MAGN|nr:hypothetical protein IFM89_039744 [Coptis chinensis]